MAEDIKFTDLNSIRIAKLCHASWQHMQKVDGNRVRHCGECDLNVYNLSEMSRREAVELVAAHEGQLCVRFYRRKDGTILTQDCPVGVKAADRTFLKIAGRILVWPFRGMLTVLAKRYRMWKSVVYSGGMSWDSGCPPDLADLYWEHYEQAAKICLEATDSNLEKT